MESESISLFSLSVPYSMMIDDDNIENDSLKTQLFSFINLVQKKRKPCEILVRYINYDRHL
jgi:hypothetical protein